MRSRKLLEASRAGVNPFEGMTPRVPSGVILSTEGKDKLAEFEALEAEGMKHIGHTAFVLVAGGLGERLGYQGIKVELPSEITTEACFLSLYAQNILAFQSRARAAVSVPSDWEIPLVIMTSDDTDRSTRALLQAHGNFGLSINQLSIVKQEKVPAMVDNHAHLALDSRDPYELSTKPHGHGDVHTLLFQSGLAEQWAAKGIKYVVFFQDTNGLVFFSVPAAVGVSETRGFHVNSLAVPRRPGEAVGAICHLTRQSDHTSITLNVEYNQLEALMTGSGVRDECDEQGYSKFPGNINVLVFDCKHYASELKKSRGVMPEFVNPKYKDAAKTVFDKPTRLECMMQDYPKLLGSDEVRVGFTQCERWMSFSAVKNKLDEAVKKQKQTGYAESASSGEFDIYRAHRKRLQLAGVTSIALDSDDAKSNPAVTYAGIQLTNTGAKVVLAPNVACTVAELRTKIPHPERIRISPRSTLVVKGSGVSIDSLELDGALVIEASEKSKVNVEGLKVENEGWEFVPLDSPQSPAAAAFPSGIPEKYQIRGYTLVKKGGAHTLA